jgi:cytochrome c biogenesis protein CcmG/thiol:disulfide interchange protein DsbE
MSGVAFPRRRLLLLAPLGVAAAGGLAFWSMLTRMESGQFDPHDIGNPMLGKKMPDFDLGGLDSAPGFSSKDLLAAAQKQPVLVNFFMSTCVPCAEEADALGELARQGLQIWGIAWEDDPAKATAFLDKYGNPFARVADDKSGGTAINFGIYGVPESFLIDRTGRIVWHTAGALSGPAIERGLMPALAKARSS